MSRVVATFFGIGLFPVAPGAAASAAALFTGATLLHPLALPAAAALAYVAGFAAIPGAVPDRDADPGWVVTDAARPARPGLLA